MSLKLCQGFNAYLRGYVNDVERDEQLILQVRGLAKTYAINSRGAYDLIARKRYTIIFNSWLVLGTDPALVDTYIIRNYYDPDSEFTNDPHIQSLARKNEIRINKMIQDFMALRYYSDDEY